MSESLSAPAIICAYYYPGWHHCVSRDAAFPKEWSEWDLVFDCLPRFPGHEQPNIPLWGREDDSDPGVFSKKIKTARDYGVDGLVFAFYWSRGKQVLNSALNEGFLRSPEREKVKFALMWANRMPRKVLPVKNPRADLIESSRLVYTDSDDFIRLIQYVAMHYFSNPNYLRIQEALYFSIFDTSFFIRQMGPETARSAILKARTWLRGEGFGELHLAAIDPVPEFQPIIREIGFNSVTHYVLLPEWKGAFIQDFRDAAKIRIEQWPQWRNAANLPYYPAVATGWDASSRSSDYGKEKPRRYPWWPVIVGRNPQVFQDFLKAAILDSGKNNADSPMVFIASWNEWSEGHYLEPDLRYGYDWLAAIRKARCG